MLHTIKLVMTTWHFSLKTRITFFLSMLTIISIIIYLFPHLFPDFVAYAITNDTLEASPSDNLSNTEERTTNPSHFPNPIQKEGLLLTGYVAY